jgi:hypothetical protein
VLEGTVRSCSFYQPANVSPVRLASFWDGMDKQDDVTSIGKQSRMLSELLSWRRGLPQGGHLNSYVVHAKRIDQRVGSFPRLAPDCGQVTGFSAFSSFIKLSSWLGSFEGLFFFCLNDNFILIMEMILTSIVSDSQPVGIFTAPTWFFTVMSYLKKTQSLNTKLILV